MSKSMHAQGQNYVFWLFKECEFWFGERIFLTKKAQVGVYQVVSVDTENLAARLPSGATTRRNAVSRSFVVFARDGSASKFPTRVFRLSLRDTHSRHSSRTFAPCNSSPIRP